ncbi:MAG TPA: ATP-binding protein [Gaiellaceae bacterium]
MPEPGPGSAAPEGDSGLAGGGIRHFGKGWRLRVYFAVLAASFVAVAAAAIGYVEVQTDRDARHAGQQEAGFAAGVAAAQLEDGVSLLRSTIKNLATNPQVVQALTAPHPAPCSLTFDMGGLGGGHVDILRADGTPICSSRVPATGHSLSGYGHAAWLPRALQTPLSLAPIRDSVTGRWVALFAVPIGSGKGVVVSFFDVAPLGRALGALYGAGRPAEFLLVHGDPAHGTGIVITRSIDPHHWIGASLAGTVFARPGQSIEHRDLDGLRRVYAESPIPGVDWTMYVGEDSAALAAAGSRLEDRQLLIIAVGLIGTLLAAALIYRRVARPIARLAGAVRSSTVDSPPRPVEVAGPAEVRALGEDINRLIASVGAELTERMQTEEALRASEESYRQLFERHPGPMWLFDMETRRFLTVNDAAIASYGYSRKEFLAMTIEDIRPEGDRAALDDALRDEGRGYSDAGVWRHRKKDGTLIDVAIYSNTVEVGTVTARVVLALDVTAQRTLEAQLRQSQKMEAIGSLAGGIAHDFNNILTVIRGYSSLLKPALDDERSIRAAAQIDRAAEQAAKLTAQLLAFSRQQVMRPEVSNLNSAVEETVTLLERLLGEHILLETQLDPALTMILVDRIQLAQVIMNLVVNARDAMPDGGTLAIRTQNTELDEVYAGSHSGVSPGRYVQLEVTDSGVGMDEEIRSRLFDPFYTTKASGTGLGLSTVYGIVSQSGGHIWVYSEPGIGTTFKVYFPTTDDPINEAAVSPEVTSLEGDETILLVEDNESLRPLVAEVLESYGYTVLTATNGVDALELRDSEPFRRIDLLLTDVVMPFMSGRELAEKLTADNPRLRVLFTSGYPSDTVIRHGIASARTAFIQKPYLADELALKIREVLAAEVTVEPA